MIMKKLSALFIMLALTGTAWADIKCEMVQYKCMDCGKEFMAFKGDTSLDGSQNKNMLDPRYQLSHVYQLGNKDNNFPDCSSHSKAHRFKNRGERSQNISMLTYYLNSIAAVKDGGSLNIKLQEWKCVLCGRNYYTLGNEELNIRDWEKQQEFIFNLNGKAIPECPKKGKHLYGHVFEPTNSSSGHSYDIAKNLSKIYWVK